jgi:hypothetical protein
MNLMSTVVGISIMGVAAPSMMQMSLAPHEAQLRAKNLGVAETAAVVFAATYEGGTDIPPAATATCTSSERESTANAYSVTCTEGIGKYVQSVTRAFRLAVPEAELDSEANTQRQFEFETPTRFSGHQCPTHDAWGVNGYNDQYYTALGGACIPKDAWNQTKYQFSNPDNWLYDINNHNGWGHHPDYDDLGSCEGDYDSDNGHGNSGGYDCSNPGNSTGTGA